MAKDGAGHPALLIVDDSATVRKMIIAALHPLDATFAEAASGLEAIEQLALRPYDAITLDINMPDMHGEEFLRFVRSQDGLKDIPILVVSTRSSEIVRSSILSEGANEYIVKPFAPGDILAAVKSLLES